MTDLQKTSILTGIKPTGTPHIGNYFGAIEPALRRAANYPEAYFFIADYHALNSVQNAEELKSLTYSVAAMWLAAGLDPTRMHFYRQSDVPEVFELETLLNMVTPKGWMNKMHAYKAAVDRNRAANKPDDNEVNMGLYTYPILMSADILIFNATHVPVGHDQIQHVEIARDIAQRFNSAFNADGFVLPEHVVEDEIAEITGLDGRKMSKSYNNTIPLYVGREGWADAVRKLVTDSVDHTDETIRQTTFYSIYQVVAGQEAANTIASGIVSKTIGWKDAKDRLVDALDARFGAQAARYQELLANPEHIDAILAEGAAKVRPIAAEHLARLRAIVGV